MYFKIIAAIALMALVMLGCSGVDPLSASGDETSDTEGSQPIGIAPGEPHPDAFVNLKDWLRTDLAADLNGDGEIAEDDFRLFLAATSPLAEPGDEPAIAPPTRLPDGDDEPVTTPRVDIRGTVTEISVPQDANEEIVAVILIEGQVEEDTNVDKAWLTITTGTFIGIAEGDEFVKLPFSELKPGQTVEAIFAGPVRESYPVQANARALLILPD